MTKCYWVILGDTECYGLAPYLLSDDYEDDDEGGWQRGLPGVAHPIGNPMGGVRTRGARPSEMGGGDLFGRYDCYTVTTSVKWGFFDVVTVTLSVTNFNRECDEALFAAKGNQVDEGEWRTRGSSSLREIKLMRSWWIPRPAVDGPGCQVLRVRCSAERLH